MLRRGIAGNPKITNETLTKLLLDIGGAQFFDAARNFVRVLAESRYGESVNSDAGTLLPVNTDLGFPLTSPPDNNIAISVTPEDGRGLKDFEAYARAFGFEYPENCRRFQS